MILSSAGVTSILLAKGDSGQLCCLTTALIVDEEKKVVYVLFKI